MWPSSAGSMVKMTSVTSLTRCPPVAWPAGRDTSPSATTPLSPTQVADRLLHCRPCGRSNDRGSVLGRLGATYRPPGLSSWAGQEGRRRCGATEGGALPSPA